MKVFLGASVVAACALAASAYAGGQRGVVRSSALILHGRVRCTATIATPARVGHALRVTFKVRNVSKRSVAVPLSYGSLWLVVRGSDGAKYDTRVPLRHELGPYIPPTKLEPGQTERRSLPYLRVRWSGPLRITPGCETKALPALHVHVTSPGRPASGRAAVAEVVAASGHLLDHCRPRLPGVAVTGTLEAPHGAAPPMRARCSISLERERGFLLAQELVVTPPKLKVRLRQPYESLTAPGARGNTEAVAWEFVVTRNRATSVYSSEIETTRSARHMAPDWTWSRKGPSASAGGSACGGSGEGFGGVAGPDVSWVSVCVSR